MHAYVYLYVHVYVYVYVHIHVYVYVFVRVYQHTYMFNRPYMYVPFAIYICNIPALGGDAAGLHFLFHLLGLVVPVLIVQVQLVLRLHLNFPWIWGLGSSTYEIYPLKARPLTAAIHLRIASTCDSYPLTGSCPPPPNSASELSPGYERNAWGPNVPDSARLAHTPPSSSSIFLITRQPRVEWYTSLWALNTSPTPHSGLPRDFVNNPRVDNP